MRIRQVSSMSPHIDIKSKWDPSSLRLDQGRLIRSQGITHQGRRTSPIRGKFIAGPVDVKWVCRASRLGVKTLLVGLVLWHLKGLRKADTFVVSNLMVRDWGIEPDAKRRALRKLEKIGLIRIERRGKRSPQVTLVLQNNAAATTS